MDMDQASEQTGLALNEAKLTVQSCIEGVHLFPREAHEYDVPNKYYNEIHSYDETAG